MGQSSLKNKVAIVTGASNGIGEAIAIALSKEGAQVVLAARNESKLQKLQKRCGKKCLAIPTDIRKFEDVKRLVEKTYSELGKIDALINNAGVFYSGDFEKITTEQAKELLETNVLGTFLGCKYVLPVMKHQKSGHIINVSSVVGTRAQPFLAMYSATKFAVMGLSEALNQELKQTGIVVTTLRPGTVKTDLFGKGVKTKIVSALEPEDIAEAVVFILNQPKRAVIRDLMIHPA